MNATTQEKLEQVHRHGYAVYAEGEILIGWTLTLQLALKFPTAHVVENVQNGSRVIV